jgi:DNA-binding transcriptional ArsR family regulator
MLTGIRLREKVKPFAIRQTALAHPIRLSILYLLANSPMLMHEIAENVDYPGNLVSHHLSVLLKGGWVQKVKLGKTVTYSLREHALFDFFRLFEGTSLERNVIEKRLK